MGKSSLIIVLGLGGILSFFTLRLNSNSNENSRATINMFEQTQARLIANSGVEIYLEKLYKNPSLINTKSGVEKLFNGTYTVKLDGTLPNVRVTSVANFSGVKHTSVADAYLEPISFPDVPAGLYITTTAFTKD